MQPFEKLLLENRAWSSEMLAEDPAFFQKQLKQQNPHFLWIGCSDSRVPAELVVNATPGEIFVHRNIANQIITTDFNSLSVVQFAVQVLGVKHIIVCGHYGCGGVKAALEQPTPGLTLVNSWLMHVKDIHRLHEDVLQLLETPEERCNRLVELNIIEQIHKLSHLPIIQHAWKSLHAPTLHGWVYDMEDGLIHELLTLTPEHEVETIYSYRSVEPGV